jgi:hypothetical protein
MFTKSAGKKNFAGKHVQTPKGRRFQAMFDFVCSRDAEARGDTRESLFTPRRAGRFRKESRENVRGMRRQGEIRGQACSHPEGQGVSGKVRLRMFAGGGGKGKDAVNPVHTPKGRACQEKIGFVCSFCEGKQGLERMLSWGNHGYPSNYKAKPFFLPERRRVGGL